jgi:DNA-directed RNA polymerase subunit RPC12/RpoP
MPSGPEATTLPGSSGGPVLTQVVEYRCTKCGAKLSASVKAGDYCPNCHAYLAYSEEPDGTRKYAGVGPMLGRGVMGAGVLVVIAMVVGFFIKLVRGD